MLGCEGVQKHSHIKQTHSNQGKSLCEELELLLRCFEFKNDTQDRIFYKYGPPFGEPWEFDQGVVYWFGMIPMMGLVVWAVWVVIPFAILYELSIMASKLFRRRYND